jgi:hypothetical protein
VGAEADAADADIEDDEVLADSDVVLDSDEGLYLFVDMSLIVRGRDAESGEGAGVGRNGFAFDVVQWALSEIGAAGIGTEMR